MFGRKRLEDQSLHELTRRLIFLHKLSIGWCAVFLALNTVAALFFVASWANGGSGVDLFLFFWHAAFAIGFAWWGRKCYWEYQEAKPGLEETLREEDWPPREERFPGWTEDQLPWK